MEKSNIYEMYNSVWNSFILNMQGFREILSAQKPENLHQLVSKLYYIPKWKLTELIINNDSVNSTPNIGGVSGFYFEYFMRLLFEEILMDRISTNTIIELELEVNSTKSTKVAAVQKQPDFHFWDKTNDRSVVVEVKVAPKKQNIESVVRYRKKYSKKGIQFCFIGGWVSATATYLSIRRGTLD